MDTTLYYSRVNAVDSNLLAAIARRERAFEGSDGSWVWLVTTESLEGGPQAGRANQAVMVTVHDRAGIPRAARALVDGGFRLSTEADFLPGGPVAECLRIQSENLAKRKLDDERLEAKTKTFMIRVPGSEA